MELEKLIDELDAWVNFTHVNPSNPEDKTVMPAGLIIHYSTGAKKWVCGYGKKTSHKHCGLGDTPKEAVLAKIAMDNQ